MPSHFPTRSPSVLDGLASPPAASKAESYIGRFAPSPSGALHFGSLIAALASWLEARQRRGAWHVRIEDIDGPRVVAGAADDILRTLAAYGLHWDGPVVYQHQRSKAYQGALEALQQQGMVYPCTCSRREIAQWGVMGQEGVIYPGHCRNGVSHWGRSSALRLLVGQETVTFRDRLQGVVTQQLEREVGDFILQRRDGIFAYHLAVVVDDADLSVTDVVRGGDLLLSTPRQIHLQRLLGYPTPRYLHLPLALAEDGEKLSKKSGAPAIDSAKPAPTLVAALAFLQQNPPSDLVCASVDTILSWALAHWQVAAVPRCRGRIWSPPPPLSQGSPACGGGFCALGGSTSCDIDPAH